MAIPRLLIAAAEGRRLPPARVGAAPAGEVQPGRYRVAGVGPVVIADVAGALTVRPPALTRHRLVPAGGGWRYAPGLDVYVAATATPGELRWSSVFVDARGRRED